MFACSGSLTSRQCRTWRCSAPSHSEALLSTFDAAARDQGRTLVHIGLGGCPPLLGVDVAHGQLRCRDLRSAG
nr:SGNH hydrolase domain-containing protein [Pseudomonas congelans]